MGKFVDLDASRIERFVPYCERILQNLGDFARTRRNSWGKLADISDRYLYDAERDAQRVLAGVKKRGLEKSPEGTVIVFGHPSTKRVGRQVSREFDGDVWSTSCTIEFPTAILDLIDVATHIAEHTNDSGSSIEIATLSSHLRVVLRRLVEAIPQKDSKGGIIYLGNYQKAESAIAHVIRRVDWFKGPRTTITLTPKRNEVHRIDRGAPLTDRQQQVWDFLKQCAPAAAPKTAKEIASSLRIPLGTITRHVLPKLRPLGVKNKRGRGYYVDDQ